MLVDIQWFGSKFLNALCECNNTETESLFLLFANYVYAYSSFIKHLFCNAGGYSVVWF